MNEKLLMVFIARLEEAAIHYHIYRTENWSEMLDNSRKAINNAFKEQKDRIEKLEKGV